MQLILGNRTDLLEGFMSYFPSSKSFNLPFILSGEKRAPGTHRNVEKSLAGVPHPVLRCKPQLSLSPREWPLVWRSLRDLRLISTAKPRAKHLGIVKELELPRAIVSYIFRLLQVIDPTPSTKLAMQWLGDNKYETASPVTASTATASTSTVTGREHMVHSVLLKFSSPVVDIKADPMAESLTA